MAVLKGLTGLALASDTVYQGFVPREVGIEEARTRTEMKIL